MMEQSSAFCDEKRNMSSDSSGFVIITERFLGADSSLTLSALFIYFNIIYFMLNALNLCLDFLHVNFNIDSCLSKTSYIHVYVMLNMEYLVQ